MTIYKDGKQVYARPNRINTICLPGDSEPASHHNTAIYQRICPRILGQHGGELLIHHWVFGRKLSKGRAFKYLPGMIVVGTGVKNVNYRNQIPLKSGVWLM